MKTKIIFSEGGGCSGGSCPTIYETDKESYILQGYIVTEETSITLPTGETIIELPKEFLDNFIKSQVK